MRHKLLDKKFGRSGSHRKATMVAIVCGLIERRRVTTTLEKARQARRLADRMVTLGKRGTLASRRLAISRLGKVSIVKTLFDDIAPKFADRAGGYTRLLKLGRRTGDAAETALIEWVGIEAPNRKKKRKKTEAEAKAA
jgi:large subunit ribosomal protein L17